MKGLEL